MKKPKWILAIVFVLVMAVAWPVLASTSNGNQQSASGVDRFGAAGLKAIRQANLTDQQKGELKALTDQILAARKQILEKYVEFGVLTRQQADAVIERMEQAYQKMVANGSWFEGVTGFWGYHGKAGDRLSGNFTGLIWDSVRKANLTDQQKAELKALTDQILAARKQILEKYVEFGVLTRQQADAVIERMDQAYQKMVAGGKWGEVFGLPHPKGGGPWEKKDHRPGAPWVNAVEKAKLTDDQRAQLKTLSDQIIAVRKQIIQKYVDFGVITQQQADTILSRMERVWERQGEQGLVW